MWPSLNRNSRDSIKSWKERVPKKTDTELSKGQDQATDRRDAFRAIQGEIQELDRVVAQKSARSSCCSSCKRSRGVWRGIQGS